jgi:hypothetical protein
LKGIFGRKPKPAEEPETETSDAPN